MSYKGFYKLVNRSKYRGDPTKLKYRSGLELSFMKFCDHSNKIVKWNFEETLVPYYSRLDKKNRRYIIDFWIKYIDEKEYLIEIKPRKQTTRPTPPKIKNKKAIRNYLYDCYTWEVNQDKWAAAEKFASKKNMAFMIMTEDKLRKIGVAV